MAECSLTLYAEQAIDDPRIARQVAQVMSALPERVLRDLLDDEHFHLAMEDYEPSRGTRVWFSLGNGPWQGSRSVVLRRRLATAREEFSLWVIAHELAHAFLRNGVFGQHHCPEEAADALAAEWGFPRPPRSL